MVYSKRHLSPCLFWYIARNFALPYVCALLAFVAIFLLNDIFNDLSDCMTNHVALSRIFIYFLAKQPPNLVNIIPLSILLAGSFMMVMLGRNNELTAMRAAGLSLAQCALPVWLMTLLSALLVFCINEYWGPKCAKIAFQIEMNDMYQNEYFNQLTFHHPRQHRDWSIEDVSKDGTFSKVIVRQYTAEQKSDYLVMAHHAEFKAGTWVFYDGFLQKYDATGHQLNGPREFFTSREMPFHETPKEINTHSNKAENMNIAELMAVYENQIISSERELNKIRAMIWNKITVPLLTFIAALFGIALTISTDRKSAVKGFACAIGILVCALLCSQTGLILAQHGYCPAFIGGAIPNLAFFIAGFFTMRARA